MPVRKGNCGDCGAAVLWAPTIKGRIITLDAQTTRAGNVVLAEDGVTALVYRNTAGIAPRLIHADRYVEHACEQAS